jgi:hypothetical protein
MHPNGLDAAFQLTVMAETWKTSMDFNDFSNRPARQLLIGFAATSP